MVLGNKSVDARMCKHAFNHASQQGLCACPQHTFRRREVHERGMKMFVHFQPPGHTATAQEVSHSQQPSVAAPLDTQSGEGLGCMRQAVHPGVPDLSLKRVL